MRKNSADFLVDVLSKTSATEDEFIVDCVMEKWRKNSIAEVPDGTGFNTGVRDDNISRVAAILPTLSGAVSGGLLGGIVGGIGGSYTDYKTRFGKKNILGVNQENELGKVGSVLGALAGATLGGVTGYEEGISGSRSSRALNRMAYADNGKKKKSMSSITAALVGQGGRDGKVMQGHLNRLGKNPAVKKSYSHRRWYR